MRSSLVFWVVVLFVIVLQASFFGVDHWALATEKVAEKDGAKTSEKPALIFQAFNLTFQAVAEMIPELAIAGFTHVQISPPQKSVARWEWWGRYQPVDYEKIESQLGNETELSQLIQKARTYNVKIIVDTVLNHMASTNYFPDLKFPQFSKKDFHFPDAQPCISNWTNRFDVTHFWLCTNDFKRRGKLPDLDTESPYVRSVHLAYLKKLVSMGIEGFRFDAAKHIEASYFQAQLPQLPPALFLYGEIIPGTGDDTKEYSSLMKITDFYLLGTLIDVFKPGGDLRRLREMSGKIDPLAGKDAVVFARNHDTAMDPGFYNFSDEQDWPLANAFVLARGEGVPCIYRDDFADKTVKAAISFYKQMGGKPSLMRDGKEYCAECSRPSVLFIERGGNGFAVINKGTEWFDISDAVVQGLEIGVYEEQSYHFKVVVGFSQDGHKHIIYWDQPGNSGIHVGPKTALFLVRLGSA